MKLIIKQTGHDDAEELRQKSQKWFRDFIAEGLVGFKGTYWEPKPHHGSKPKGEK